MTAKTADQLAAELKQFHVDNFAAYCAGMTLWQVAYYDRMGEALRIQLNQAIAAEAANMVTA